MSNRHNEALRQATRRAIACHSESAFTYVEGVYVGSVQFEEALQYATHQDPGKTLCLLKNRRKYYDDKAKNGPLEENQLENLQILEAAIEAVELCLSRQKTQQAVSGIIDAAK